ncbi:MAG: hypothetical protein IT372_41960, partial [Polyangiaceae bacterium]|nr:hypothetical protein [Polyangiaceae bacterium]
AFQDVVAVDPALWPELRPYTPCFEMKLIDVSEGQASHLVEEALTAMGKVALWCMSVAGDDARMEREIERIGAALLEVIRAPNGLAALEVVLRYLVATHRRLDVTKVGKLLEKAAGPQAEEAIVTWIDEIERRGERRGKREGQAEMLLRLMAARFGPVPDEVAGRVEAGSEAELGRWALRVLTAQSPADVIAGAEKHTGRRTPSARKPAARKGTGEAATTSKRRA